MDKLIKKLAAGILVFAIAAATLVSGDQTTVKAADSWKVLYTNGEYQQFTAEQLYKLNKIKTSNYGSLIIDLYLMQKTDVAAAVYTSSGKVPYGCDAVEVAASDAGWEEMQATDGSGTVYRYQLTIADELVAGTYTVNFAFGSDAVCQYQLGVYTDNANAPKLNKTSASLKKGKKVTLSVKNDTATKYATSNKSVATVSSKGVVTAKKKGTATITVTTKKGAKLKCKITVK